MVIANVVVDLVVLDVLIYSIWFDSTAASAAVAPYWESGLLTRILPQIQKR